MGISDEWRVMSILRAGDWMSVDETKIDQVGVSAVEPKVE